MALHLSRTDEIASVLLLLFAVGVFVVSRDYPSDLAGTPGPAFFPRIIAAGIAVLAIVQLARALFSGDRDEHTITQSNTARVAVPAAFLVGYVLMLPLIGFFLTTVVFLTTFMYYSGARTLYVTVPLAVVIGVVLQNVFVGFLHVPLPSGRFGIRHLFSLTTLPGVNLL